MNNFYFRMAAVYPSCIFLLFPDNVYETLIYFNRLYVLISEKEQRDYIDPSAAAEDQSVTGPLSFLIKCEERKSSHIVKKEVVLYIFVQFPVRVP